MNESFDFQMSEILDTFNEDLNNAIKKSSMEVAKECASKLQTTSPRRKGKYAKGWTYKSKDGIATVFNQSTPSLTHLLENGHVISNHNGTYGYQSGISHIKPVEEWGIEEFERRITNDNM